MLMLKKEEDVLLLIVGHVQRKKRVRQGDREKVIVTNLSQLGSLVEVVKKKVKYMDSKVFFYYVKEV